MKFIKVNYMLNRRYLVEDSALEEAVKKTIAKDNDVTLIDSGIYINEKDNLFTIHVKVKPKKAFSYYEILNKIQNDLEESIKLLTSSNLKNIKITIEEGK